MIFMFTWYTRGGERAYGLYLVFVFNFDRMMQCHVVQTMSHKVDRGLCSQILHEQDGCESQETKMACKFVISFIWGMQLAFKKNCGVFAFALPNLYIMKNERVPPTCIIALPFFFAFCILEFHLHSPPCKRNEDTWISRGHTSTSILCSI